MQAGVLSVDVFSAKILASPQKAVAGTRWRRQVAPPAERRRTNGLPALGGIRAPSRLNPPTPNQSQCRVGRRRGRWLLLCRRASCLPAEVVTRYASVVKCSASVDECRECWAPIEPSKWISESCGVVEWKRFSAKMWSARFDPDRFDEVNRKSRLFFLGWMPCVYTEHSNCVYFLSK